MFRFDSITFPDDFFKPKIVYPETTQGAYFAFDDAGMFLEKTCFMLISDDAEYLQLTLSSKLFEYAYKKIFSSVALGKHGYQYNKHALIKLPILKQSKEVVLNKDNLDATIYQLYGLTEQEIKEIEGV